MAFHPLGDHCFFLYSSDLELLFAANSLLQGELVHKLCTQTYGEPQIAELKKRHPFLFEVFEAHASHAPLGFFEPLMKYPLERFSLDGYCQFLLELPREELIWLYFAVEEITTGEIALALEDDAKLESLFLGEPKLCDSLLGLRSMLHHMDRFVHEYISLAKALRTPAFEKLIASYQKAVSDARSRAQEALSVTQPLAYSEILMGKTFHHRGPYESFVFSVSLFMPCRALRFMGDRQILFQTLRKLVVDDGSIVSHLKAMADPSRFQIITLIGEKGPIRGTDIAKALSLTPPTVSHHMEQLKKAGIILEEPVKNSRYYSLNREYASAILERLSKAFGNEK